MAKELDLSEFGGTPQLDLSEFQNEPVKPSGAIRRIADQGIKLAQGVVGLPEAAVGVADLVTGGQAGKMAENAGVRFKDARDIMGEYLSPEQKAADAEVQKAEGFLPTLGAMVKNPSTIVGQALQSAPSMLGGAGVARGALALAPKIGAIAAGALGEGVVSSGQNAEQVRQEDPNGTLTGKQSALLAGSGLLTGGISLASGKVANKLGIGDVQTMLAAGKLGPVGAEATQAAAKKGITRKLAEGVINEGVLQELPQSYQEQVAQNLAQGKPWDEGAAAAGAQGMLAGALMGGGANLAAHFGEQAAPAANQPAPVVPTEPDAPPLQLGNTPDPYLSFPDGTVAKRSEIDAYINGLPPDQQPAARAKAMGLAPQPSVPEAVAPSAAMGLDPAAGPISAAAAIAVDAGVHQAHLDQQAAEQEALASEADQAAYDQYLAEQDQQAAQNDTINQSVTKLAEKQAEAQMSDEDKRAVLYSNQPVLDGGKKYKGTLDGDILNGLGKPYPTWMTALRRAKMEGTSWGIAKVADGFVARRKEAPNGQTSAVSAGTGTDTGNGPAVAAGDVQSGNSTGQRPGTEAELPAKTLLGQPAGVPGGSDAGAVATRKTSSETGKPPTSDQTQPLDVGRGQSSPEEQPVSTQFPTQPLDARSDQSSPEGYTKSKEETRQAQDQLNSSANNTPLAANVQAPNSSEQPTGQPPAMPLGEQAAKPPSSGPIQSVISKLIPDMTDAELQQAVDHYGPDHKRTPKLLAAMAKRNIQPTPEQVNGPQADQTQPQQTQQQKAPAEPATAGVAPKQGVRAKIEKARQARADYFTPGNIVHSYGGTDEVLSYTPPKSDGSGWSVKVQEVKKVGGQWVRVGKPQDARQHTTQPDAAQLAKGPIERLGHVPSGQVQYSEPRADGKPFPNAHVRGVSPAPEVETPVSLKEQARILRETETSTFTSLANSPDLIDKSVADIAEALKARLPDSKPEQIAKMAQTLHKQLAKNAAELAKAKHRDPAVYKAAVDGALLQHGIEGDADKTDRFQAGWSHALAGKTKSTLSGDMLADQVRGYEGAKEWMKTEEGAAWYEGRPASKLQNTGIDLRRHWEAMQAQMKANESDINKAWKQIEKATARADLFTPLLPDNALPGFKLYVDAVRSNMVTFKDWLEDGNDRWYGSTVWKRRGDKTETNLGYILQGKRYPSALSPEDRQKFETDEAYRINYLQDAAARYLGKAKALISFMDGTTSVREAAEKFDALYTDPDYKGVNKSNYDYYKGLNKAGHAADSKSALWGGKSYEFYNLRSTSDWSQHLIEKEATIALPTRADPLTPPKLDRVTRDGLTDQRKGASITPEEFKKTFGFADVGFGKWVASKQDQDHLNYAYDALMDLANHFGTAPKNIGFGQQLHFTIGALGHGKFAAHFWAAQPHPDGGVVQVINLTNTKGDGTVYHEWTHALDHNLGGEWKSSVRGQVLRRLKAKTLSALEYDQIAKRFLTGGAYWTNDKNMNKVDAAVKGLAHYSGNSSGTTAYKVNADKLGKDYWGNEAELIARAAEAWASDTLGGTDTYLVNPEWVGEGKASPEKGHRGTPYPTGHERQLFNQVYTALAKSVKWEGGKPTITSKDFQAALPANPGEERRQFLSKPANMQQFYDDLVAEQTEKASAAQSAKEAAARSEQEAMDEAAAEKLKELATIDPPTPSETTGELSEDDLSAMFDQAAAELREDNQEKPDAAAPGEAQNTQPVKPTNLKQAIQAKAAQKSGNSPSATALIAEAAKLGVKGADEALRGLSALFGKPGRLNSFPGGFDEETYQQAKPHFEAALKSFQDAGKTLIDLFKMLINQFGDGIKEYAVRFAKDEKLTAQLGQQASASSKVADKVQVQLENGAPFDWRMLFGWADESFGGTQGEGKYTPKDAYDAMEMGVNRYLMTQQGRAFNPNSDRETALLTIAALERVTNLLPTQTKRTAEQDEFQQFSTVPALAFAANWAANITQADTMLEPSGGIGGLAVFAKNAGAKLILNELSSRRAALLQEVFPAAQVFSENAEQIDNILPVELVPSVVVMNPPFSSSASTGVKKTLIGARHVEQALSRLADGGRLVAIVGEGMTMDKPAFKDWWKKISALYDVRAVIPMDGSGYAKYGTTFDNAILVIDKVKPSGKPVATTRASNYNELVGILSEIRDDRPTANIPTNDRDGVERDTAESSLGKPDETGSGGVVAGETAHPATAGVGTGKPGSGPTLVPGGGRGGRPGITRRPGSAVSKPGESTTGIGNNAETSGADNSERSGGPDTAGDRSGVNVSSNDVVAGELTDSVYEGYTPQRLKVEGATPHPGALVQSSAMASVLPPAATYTPNLPKETITEGKLSLAQIEAVVYAGQAHGEVLESKSDPLTLHSMGLDGKGVQADTAYRRGFFIGDGTGVGKGREIGGIILDNIRQGRKKHVWISEKQGLMTDAKRDFAGVGGIKDLIFNQNDTLGPNTIDPKKEGIIFTTYATLRASAQDVQAGGFKKGDPVTVRQFGDARKAEGTLVSISEKKGAVVKIDGTNTSVRLAAVVSIDDDHNWMAKVTDKTKSPQKRIDQLVNWLGADFDGVIAFDEAHNAGNAVAIKGERGSTQPSAQALAVVELQNRLPNARVVYVSATGATEVSNLSFANRLGLWGPGTAFASLSNFVAEMVSGGLATMELVARDMKQMGAYIARSLSFDGVTYSRLEHDLTDIQNDQYNRMAQAWQVTLQNMGKALEVTGAAGEDGAKKKNDAKKNMKSAYWGAQQRFFNQIITSMQMPTVLDSVERDLANGDAVVLQLVNTNEASQERALAKRKEDDESTDLEDLDMTPRDQLLQMVAKSFPVQQYEDYIDSDGKRGSRLVVDSEDKPVENREAVRMREKLLQDLRDIKVPDGPLEILINHFGPEITAEITGRKQRVVSGRWNKSHKGNDAAPTFIQKRGSSSAKADADAFMADKKRILVFSDAGGTGFSFHADLTAKNQRPRKHYLLQPGWRANKAVQGLGRTHRTNQKSAPHYTLVSTDIPAHKRFLSSIARRLDQLGALTKGQRDTSSGGLFTEKDNLESKYAHQAATQLIQDIQRGQVEGINFHEFLRQMGLEDIVNPDTHQIADDKYPKTSQFLNRLLSLEIPMQNKVFDAFIARMDEKVEVAASRGELDTGMQTIRAIETKITNEEVVYTDPRTKAETKYIELEATQPNRFYTFPNETTQGGKIRWLTNSKSGRVWAVLKSGTMTHRNGAVVDRYRALGTGGTQIKEAGEFTKDSWKEITIDQARALWDAENAVRPATYVEKINLISGAMLPIWDRLKTDGTIQVARTQTTDGRRLLGRVISQKDVADIRKRLNIASPASKLTPDQVMARILKGDTGELANGWTLKRARVSDDLRIELSAGYLSGAASLELTGMGIIKERISWSDRYFVPTGKDGVPVLSALFKNKPLVELSNPEAPAVGDEPVNFARSTRPVFSRGAKTQATQQVEKLVNAIKANWANAPEIVVAFDMSDEHIPERVRAEDLKQRSGGAVGTPEGFYYKGKVYLMSSQLATPNDVARVLAHEALGHYGLRGMFGDALKPILQQIATMRKAEVDAKIKEYGLRSVNNLDRLTAAEEVLAGMAQNKPELGFVKRAISAIRNWLRANVPGFSNIKLTDNDIIQQFILPARGWVERGQGQAGGAAAFNRGKNEPVTKFDNASGDYNPDLDNYWLKQGSKEINGERMSDADYHQAIAEYANSWRVESLLEKLGFKPRGSSNVSSSMYYEKYDEANDHTYEVRVSDHDDYHPADSLTTRIQLNFRDGTSDWSSADIGPDLSNAEALNRIRDALPKQVTEDVPVVGNQGGRSADDTTPGDRRDDLAREYMEFHQSDPARAKAAFQAMSDIDAKARETESAAPKQEDTYKGEHEAPMHDSGAPLHDLKGVYPDDFYGPEGQRFYGIGDGSDARSMSTVRALKGRPGTPVNVYRAVPEGVDAKIQKGDWVTIDRQYAKDHGDGALNGKYKIIRKTVRADELFTNGDSIQEWGYDPKKSRNEPTAPDSGGAFSRSLGDTLNAAANNVRGVNLAAGYKVGDLINSAPGKLNWWHKSVGTQYNLAQREPAFKKVYDSVQNFINDVSYYATEAADLAPTILPKLETLKDIGKSPLSAQDTKALSAPVFEGTLIWARDESGKPVKMEALEHNAANLTTEQKARRLLRNNHIREGVLKMWQGLDLTQYENLIEAKYEKDMLKPGVVWTPAELKSIFKLDDKQVGLYQEFRKATDKSLTNLAIADMLRFGGNDVYQARDEALAAKSVTEAAEILRDHLLMKADFDVNRKALLLDSASKMIEKGDKAAELMARGYAPLSRFGQYTLDVVHEGERVYFGLFENKWEAAKMNRKMQGLFPGATINQGTVSEQAYKLFAGVSPETLALFGDMLGLEAGGDGAANEAFQTYLKLALSNRSAMKRLIQRKGIAGFSEDAGRVLAGFVYSNARQTSSSLHMGDMTTAAADKEAFSHNGELQDAATKLVEYIKNPQEEAQAFRGLMFAQYIGGSVASAMVNLTQPLTMTFPWLAQYGTVTGAAKQMLSATKDANRKTTGDAKLDAALHKAEEDGTVSPQEVHQLMQQAMGRGVLRSGDGTTAGNALATAQNTLSRISLAWGKMFSTAEQFNRRVTFIAAYRTAVESGMADPDAFARKAIAETQGVYNRGNKPQWARGALGSTIFTFKQYSIAYVEMLSRMAKNGPEGRKAALLALAVMFVLSGASGLPGSDDLDDIISGALQAMGYNFDSKQKRKEFFVSLIGEGGAQFMELGVSGLPGVPVDVSGRLGLGNLIPGTGLFTKKTDHARDVAEFAGVAGDFIKRGFDTASKVIKGDIVGAHGAVATLAPKAAQNLFQAYDMANTGMYRDAQGRKVLDTDAGDAVSKALGLQPNDVKRVQDASSDAMRMIGQNRIRESEIAGEWAAGLFEKDQAKVQAARDDLKQWNIDNPDSPIKINFRQVLQRVNKMKESKIERIAKTAPKEIRATVKRELLASQ